MSDHTKGRLRLSSSGLTLLGGPDDPNHGFPHGRNVATTTTHCSPAERLANARRLAAAWNLLLPFTTAEIEEAKGCALYGFEPDAAKLTAERDARTKERDELLAAAERVIEVCNSRFQVMLPAYADPLQKLAATIARCREVKSS